MALPLKKCPNPKMIIFLGLATFGIMMMRNSVTFQKLVPPMEMYLFRVGKVSKVYKHCPCVFIVTLNSGNNDDKIICSQSMAKSLPI